MIPRPLETSAKTWPARSVNFRALVGAPISRRIQSLSTVLMVGLGGYLLCKKSIGRRGGNATGGSMRLIEEAAFL